MGDWSQSPDDFVAPLFLPTEGLKMPLRLTHCSTCRCQEAQ